MARTDTLPNFLTDVANAIRGKKGTEETIQASDFDTEIANLPSGGGDISEYFNTTINSYAYVGGPPFISDLVQKKIPAIIIGNNVTSLHGAFYQSGIEEIEDVVFNNNITDLVTMFSGCANLISVGLNNGVTTNVTSMYEMFNGCRALISLDLSNWETPNLTNTTRMFANCVSLTHIDIRKMTFNNVTSNDFMFGGSASGGVPNNCEIIVKSQTEKEWITSKFSRLTNVKTVAELE